MRCQKIFVPRYRFCRHPRSRPSILPFLQTYLFAYFKSVIQVRYPKVSGNDSRVLLWCLLLYISKYLFLFRDCPFPYTVKTKVSYAGRNNRPPIFFSFNVRWASSRIIYKTARKVPSFMTSLLSVFFFFFLRCLSASLFGPCFIILTVASSNTPREGQGVTWVYFY